MESRIIKNLDELVLPRREIVLFGRKVSVRRIDEIGLITWSEIEGLEIRKAQASIDRKNVDVLNEGIRILSEVDENDVEAVEAAIEQVKQNAEAAEAETRSIAIDEINITVELACIYLYSDVGSRLRPGISDELKVSLENLSTIQFREIINAFTSPPPLEAGVETKDLTQETSQDSNQSTEEIQNSG